ncbi:hypothetical protein J6590_097722 [Homalodisca vitripennis]|nr:hypothetical protein J6590_097722 [Homalodisca vitripennis]
MLEFNAYSWENRQWLPSVHNKGRKTIKDCSLSGTCEDFQYIEPNDTLDMLTPDVRGQTGISSKEAAASFRLEACGPVKDPILDEPLMAAELGYPSMSHVDLFNPLCRPESSLHPSPMELNVTESFDDDLITLIDDAGNNKVGIKKVLSKPEFFFYFHELEAPRALSSTNILTCEGMSQSDTDDFELCAKTSRYDLLLSGPKFFVR